MFRFVKTEFEVYLTRLLLKEAISLANLFISLIKYAIKIGHETPKKDLKMIGEINAEELKNKLDKKENFILVDVREQNEWDAGHIPGALFVPLSQFDQEYEKHLSDPDAEVVVQCRSGKRSMDACMRLQGEGFSNLKNMTGGILEWIEQGHPIEK